MRFISMITAVCGLAVCNVAQAHVTLEVQEAAIGSGYKAVFRVPHGCGNSATIKVRVRIPDGVIAVKPMLKPGWQVETVKGKYEKAYSMYHTSGIAEGVKELSWTGRLPDENYDEFIASMYLTVDLVPNSTLYFPVVQECESGTNRWIEIPEAGKSSDDYKEPAPGLKLLPKR